MRQLQRHPYLLMSHQTLVGLLLCSTVPASAAETPPAQPAPMAPAQVTTAPIGSTQMPTAQLATARQLTSQRAFRQVAARLYYREWVRRDPTEQEVTLFEQPWARGSTGWEISLVDLLGSDAYYKHAGESPKGFVKKLYTDVWGRKPNKTEREQGTSHVAGGKSRTGIATSLLTNPEGHRQTARFWFKQLVQRKPTAEETDGLVKALRSRGVDGLVVEIVTSEAYARAGKKDVPWQQRVQADLTVGRP